MPASCHVPHEQERMHSIRREQEEAEVAECTFRPTINDRSVRMISMRQQILRESGISPYDQLYNESMRRKLKHDHLASLPPEEATFAPRINRSSVVLKRLMEGRRQAAGAEDGGLEGGALDSSGGGDVAARLLDRGRRYRQKLEVARDALEHRPVDSHTGRPLFRPATCRPPRFQRKPEGERGGMGERGPGTWGLCCVHLCVPRAVA